MNLERDFFDFLTPAQRRFVQGLPVHLRSRLDQDLEDARYHDGETRRRLFADALAKAAEAAEEEAEIERGYEAMAAMTPQDWKELERHWDLPHTQQ